MTHNRRIHARNVYWTLLAISLLAGLLMPEYYDLTGADQRYMPLVVPITGGAMILLAVLLSVALWWIPIRDDRPERDPAAQFSTRFLLGLTLAASVAILGLLRWREVAAGILNGAAFLYAGWVLMTRDGERWPTVTLVGCMAGPYAWIITHLPPVLEIQDLAMLVASLPGFLPTALASAVVGVNLHETLWLALLLTAAEMMVGLWMIRLGPKRAIIYIMAALVTSIIGSFGIHALMRA